MKRTKTTKPQRTGVTVQVADLRHHNVRTLYDKSVPDRIRDLAKLGLTLAQMAKAMGTHAPTLEQWFQKFPEVRAAYDEGRYVHDHAVQLSLLQRAMGFSYWEEKEVDGVDSLGRPYHYTTKTKKKVLSDVTAAIFWLKNRDPENWRDVRPGDGATNILNVDMSKTLNLDSLDANEKKMLRSIAIKQLSEMNGITGD